jgi:hypothetical protein
MAYSQAIGAVRLCAVIRQLKPIVGHNQLLRGANQSLTPLSWDAINTSYEKVGQWCARPSALM